MKQNTNKNDDATCNSKKIMDEKPKKQHGGKRNGSGRKSKESVTTIKLGKKASFCLTVYSGLLNISKRDLADDIIFFYLNSENKDFLHCPKCNNPCLFKPKVQKKGKYTAHCKCGNIFEIET